MNEQKNTTKTQIKQAAIRQIEKFGIDKTSMRSIAAEANMTTGAIYYYYKNKQDLFDEIVTDSIHFVTSPPYFSMKIENEENHRRFSLFLM